MSKLPICLCVLLTWLVFLTLAGCGYGPFSKPKGSGDKGLGLEIPLNRDAGITREDLISSDNIEIERLQPLQSDQPDGRFPSAPPSDPGTGLFTGP